MNIAIGTQCDEIIAMLNDLWLFTGETAILGTAFEEPCTIAEAFSADFRHQNRIFRLLRNFRLQNNLAGICLQLELIGPLPERFTSHERLDEHPGLSLCLAFPIATNVKTIFSIFFTD